MKRGPHNCRAFAFCVRRSGINGEPARAPLNGAELLLELRSAALLMGICYVNYIIMRRPHANGGDDHLRQRSSPWGKLSIESGGQLSLTL